MFEIDKIATQVATRLSQSDSLLSGNVTIADIQKALAAESYEAAKIAIKEEKFDEAKTLTEEAIRLYPDGQAKYTELLK